MVLFSIGVALFVDIERSKAILTKADKNLITSAAEDFDANSYEKATRGGDKYTMKRGIESQKKIFDNKYLEGARTKVSDILEQSDIMAIKKKYSRALAGYLKANGKSVDILNSTNEADIAFAERARDYAIKQAKEATFHEDNAFAEWLSETSKNAERKGGAARIGELAIESLVPFKKTPANILKEGVEYSPLGFIEGIYKAKTQNDVNAAIDAFAKGATGTTILGIGAFLASRGMLVAQLDDEDDPFGKGADFSIKLGNKSYTLDWLAPAALPLFLGAQLYDDWGDVKNGEDISFWDWLGTLTEPVVEMSMLQGIKNTITSISDAAKKNEFAGLATNIAAGYVSQSIPTVAGQIARTIDKTRRTTSVEASATKAPVLNAIEKQGKKAMNKIPGLSMLNKPYVDVWGEDVENAGGNILGRGFFNTLSPGYYNDLSLSDREEKLTALDKAYEGNGTLIPSLANRTYDGRRLSDKEYYDYSKSKGAELSNAVDTALRYKGKVSDKDLADYTHKIELLSNAIARKNTFGYKVEDSNDYKKAYAVYQNGGYDVVMQYYLINDNADADGNGSLKKEDEFMKFMKDNGYSAEDIAYWEQVFFPSKEK